MQAHSSSIHTSPHFSSTRSAKSERLQGKREPWHSSCLIECLCMRMSRREDTQPTKHTDTSRERCQSCLLIDPSVNSSSEVPPSAHSTVQVFDVDTLNSVPRCHKWASRVYTRVGFVIMPEWSFKTQQYCSTDNSSLLSLDDFTQKATNRMRSFPSLFLHSSMQSGRWKGIFEKRTPGTSQEQRQHQHHCIVFPPKAAEELSHFKASPHSNSTRERKGKTLHQNPTLL